MADVIEFPFADVSDLKARWPDFPPGGDDAAEVLLEDASQFILDVVPSAVNVSAGTRRRIVCAVVRRSMAASSADHSGFSQFNVTGGPFTMGGTPANPHGDFYLTRNEKLALGQGRQVAFGVQVASNEPGLVDHRLWCSLNLGANYCSCGADIAGKPIYEG